MAFIIAVIIVIVFVVIIIIIIIIIILSFCPLLNSAVTAFEIFASSTSVVVSKDHSECNL